MERRTVVTIIFTDQQTSWHIDRQINPHKHIDGRTNIFLPEMLWEFQYGTYV